MIRYLVKLHQNVAISIQVMGNFHLKIPVRK